MSLPPDVPAKLAPGHLVVPPGPFVAIDFETADAGADSACAVGLVRVEDGIIVAEAVRLIRPPRRRVVHGWVHGLYWSELRKHPPFAVVWPEVEPFLDGVAFLAAHNAPFDRGVLQASCEAAGLVAPTLPFVCTVQLARRVLRYKPANLAACAANLGVPHQHHEALSDARACAHVVLAARRVLGE